MPRAALSPAEFADFRAQLGEFEQLSAFADWTANLTGIGEPKRLQGFMVSPDLFTTLGLTPALGRGFVAADEEDALTGSEPAVVLSHELWRTAFGAEPGVLGQTLQLNGRMFTVVGVASAGVRFPDSPSFLFPDRADLWVTHDWARDAEAPRGDKWLRIVGRMRTGTTLEQAQQSLDIVAARVSAQHPATYPAGAGWRPTLVPLRDQIVGDVRPVIGALAGAGALVLLIACANVANLLLARGTARAQELALRTAIGAGRARIARQLLTESLALAGLGAVLGVGVAAVTLRVLLRFAPASVPRLDQARLDPAMLGFALLAALATAVLFGLAPALRQSRADLHALLRQGGQATLGGRRRSRISRTLVATEVALSLVVLVGAGLLLRTVQKLRAADVGFTTEGVLTVRLSLPQSREETRPARAAFVNALLAQVAGLPGVTVAGAGHPLPLSGDAWEGAFLVEGQPLAQGQSYPNAEYGFVTPGFLQALQVPLRAGRLFTGADDEGAPEVAVVDEQLAQRYWPGQSAVGKRLSLAGRPDTAWATVVGVVGHVRRGGARVEGRPQIYVPFAQRPPGSIAIAVRTTSDPLRLAPALRAAVYAVDRDQPITDLRLLADLAARSAARDQFTFALLAVFAVLATFLAAVGLYGVVTARVAQRRQEIGVRMALGARPADVLRLVIGEGMAAVLAGIVVGLMAALAASRALGSLLFGIASTDAATYTGTAALLAVVALVACTIPAMRVASGSPARALRAE